MTQKQLDAKIKIVKMKIFKLQEMRPGSLSRQYNVCGVAGCRCKNKDNPQKHGPYLKLNYTQNGQSKTQFIKDHFSKEIEQQTKEFKKFKELFQMWITLEIERSNLTMKAEIAKMEPRK